MAKESNVETVRCVISFSNEVKNLGAKPINAETKNALIKIKERCKAYYQICEDYGMIPTIEGMALAFGTTWQEWTKWTLGEPAWTRGEIADYLRLEYSNLTNMIMVANEKGLMHDVSTIYRTKNSFGYQNEDRKQVMEIQIAMPTREQLIEQSKNLEIIQKK